MTPYMKTIFQQKKKKSEILTKISGSAPLTFRKSCTIHFIVYTILLITSSHIGAVTFLFVNSIKSFSVQGNNMLPMKCKSKMASANLLCNVSYMHGNMFDVTEIILIYISISNLYLGICIYICGYLIYIYNVYITLLIHKYMFIHQFKFHVNVSR